MPNKQRSSNENNQKRVLGLPLPSNPIINVPQVKNPESDKNEVKKVPS